MNRARGARDHYRVSIDKCYALVGLARRHWRGFTGGDDVWVEVQSFFRGLERGTQEGPVPDLSFRVVQAKLTPFAVSPVFALELVVTDPRSKTRPSKSIMLKCQVRIDAQERQHTHEEAERLSELLWCTRAVEPQLAQPVMDARHRAGRGIRTRSVTFEVPVPCTFDFSVASAQYLNALEGGLVSLTLLFSGTTFYEVADPRISKSYPDRVVQRSCKFALPLSIVKETIDHYYPNLAPLALRRDVFDRLYRHKVRSGAATLERALESLLPSDEAEGGPAPASVRCHRDQPRGHRPDRERSCSTRGTSSIRIVAHVGEKSPPDSPSARCFRKSGVLPTTAWSRGARKRNASFAEAKGP